MRSSGISVSGSSRGARWRGDGDCIALFANALTRRVGTRRPLPKGEANPGSLDSADSARDDTKISLQE
jgi:hypothetical protein